MSDEECRPPERTVSDDRGGVELRVIDGGMGEAQTGWDEDELADPVEDSEEVTRLDHGSGPLANRRLEDEERVDSVPLPRGNRWTNLRLLTLLMAGATILVAVGVVSLALMIEKDSSGRGSIVEVLEVVDDQMEEETADEEVLDNAEKAVRESVALFTEYYKAESVDDVVGLIREGERLKPLLEKKWKPLGEISDIVASVVNSDGLRVVILRGKSSDETIFEYVYIPTEEGLKLDWEASLVLGDVDFDELKSIEPGRTVKMRVVLGVSDFHPLEYPDDKFRCYRIWVPGFESSTYGYAPMESEVVELLADFMNEGTVLLNRTRVGSVIVNLKNGGRGEFGQFEISDVLQNGWIEP